MGEERTAEPLTIPTDNWRSRWLVTPRWGMLHRISDIRWNDDQMISGIGTSVCGVSGRFQMPGVFSRMDLPRCGKCCSALGLPRGAGAPFNSLEGEQANV